MGSFSTKWAARVMSGLPLIRDRIADIPDRQLRARTGRTIDEKARAFGGWTNFPAGKLGPCLPSSRGTARPRRRDL